MADADPQIDRATAIAIEQPAAAPRRGWLRPALMFSVPAIVLAFAGYFWLTGGRFVSTDNAYVQQDKVSVSSDIAGRIIEVNARENQTVKAGDVLFRIDPDPYRIAVEQANAAIATFFKTHLGRATA